MKILFITTSLDGNDGWSRYSKDVVGAMKKAGHEVLVYEPGKPLEYLANPLSIYLLSKKIKKQIKAFGPDIIHFLVEPYANVATYLKPGRAKMFMTAHGTFSYIPSLMEDKLKKKIALWNFYRVYKKMAGIIAVSRYTSEHMKSMMHTDFGDRLAGEKITVINNGIDLTEYGDTASIVDKGFSNMDTEKKKIILFLGAVKPRKGLIESARALGVYREKYGDKFEYRIAGKCDQESTYFHELKDEIESAGLEKNTVFLGRVSEEEKRKLYREADVFLMLSVQEGNAPEGFGLVYLEANAYGVPAMGSTHSGAEDAISDGVSGFVVDPKNPDEVAGKLHVLLNEKSRFSTAARKWAEDHDIAKVTRDIIALYEKS
ncbi:MAG: glycosyltransferase family 4 protein [Candidatus Paceibacterota bacterium]